MRELGNRIQRALIIARGDTIEPGDLGLGAATPSLVPSGMAPRGRPPTDSEPPRTSSPPDNLDREGMLALLASVDANVTRAASALGLSRQAFYRRLERLGIVLDRKKGD